MENDASVDDYIDRSQRWPDEISRLRPVLLSCGLSEDIKWGKPCYSHKGKNLLILQEMKDFLAIMFFKGALLDDPAGVLQKQGPNSRSARRIQVVSVDEVDALAGIIEDYVDEAIDVEAKGLTVDPAPDLQLVDELKVRLDQDVALKEAFEALTPGRQREYNLHFSAAKQVTTRQNRVEKCIEKILDGKGFRDR